MADEPSLSAVVQRRVEDGLVKPLADYERNQSAFSRARPVPRVRRVRVTQASPLPVDGQGRPFVTFAVDVKFGSADWRENDIVGCAYVKSGELFVKRGDGYRPATFLMGKNAEPVAGACQAAASAARS
jgi:hypothetical protein